MVYTVAEVAELVNLTKASIYTKLKAKGLQEHITKKQNITYIDEIGLKMIQCSLKQTIEETIEDFKTNTSNFKQGINDIAVSEEIATDTDYTDNLKSNIDDLKADINYLKDQIKENELKFDNQLSVKDLQINNLNERLKQEQELNKNSQILQLKQQPPDIKQLEEHFQDLDTKLQEVKENMIERKEQQNKGFFSKIFKK